VIIARGASLDPIEASSSDLVFNNETIAGSLNPDRPVLVRDTHLDASGGFSVARIATASAQRAAAFADASGFASRWR
jgi:hypothetical protein